MRRKPYFNFEIKKSTQRPTKYCNSARSMVIFHSYVKLPEGTLYMASASKNARHLDSLAQNKTPGNLDGLCDGRTLPLRPVPKRGFSGKPWYDRD